MGNGQGWVAADERTLSCAPERHEDDSFGTQPQLAAPGDRGTVLGATDGKETEYIRIENSANTIHGHPISQTEYIRLIK